MLDPDISEISWIQKISGNLSVFDFQRFPKHRDKSEGLKAGFFPGEKVRVQNNLPCLGSKGLLLLKPADDFTNITKAMLHPKL